MSTAKYFVHADGAWREVLPDGRVEGWRRRARFLYLRRGRLQLAPRRAVQRALHAHAAGLPSSVRDAARLSQRSYTHGFRSGMAPAHIDSCRGHRTHRSKSIALAPAANTHHASAAVRTDANTQCVARADASTQASPTHARVDTHTDKLNALNPGPRTHSERRPLGNGEKQTPTKRSLSTTSSDSLTDFVTKKTVASRKNVRSPKKTKKIVDSGSSEEFQVTTKTRSSTHNSYITKAPVKTKDISSDWEDQSDTSDTVVFYDRRKLRQRHIRKTGRDEIEDEPSPKRPKIADTKLKPAAITKQITENLSDTTDSEPLNNKPGVKRLATSSGDSDNFQKHSQRPPVTRRAVQTGVRRPTSSSEEIPLVDVSLSRRRRWRRRSVELVIPDEVVAALRRYIERTNCADLQMYDADDTYKASFFYSITPVVDLERCARLERALADRNLKRFAEGLGLRSVSEVSTQASSYKIRRRAVNSSYKMSSAASEHQSTDENGSETNSSKQLNQDICKTFTHKSNAQKSVHTRDGSRDTSKEIRVTRDSTKRMSNKTNAERCEDAPMELNKDENKKLPNKRRVNKAENTTNSLRDTTRENIKTLKNKRTAHTAEYNSDASKDTAIQVSKDRTSRNKRSSNERRAHMSGSSRDSSEDTLEELDKDRTTRSQGRKSTKKPNTPRSKPSLDSSEVTKKEQNQKENSYLTTCKGKNRAQKQRKVTESSAESKENVPERANRRDEAGARRGEAGRAKAGRAEPRSEDELTTSREAVLQAARNSHSISQRPSSVAKEYSNLEDHAIVAWVSGGGARARRVNGNVLWRELQEQYQRLTGRERSWHSLRNRYLRYILPSLGALHLPPAHAARLRAAAATGELKGKRGAAAQRRNSMFDKEPAIRGAASRRPHHHRPASPHPHPHPPHNRTPEEHGLSSSAVRRSLRSSGAPPTPPGASPSPSPRARARARAPVRGARGAGGASPRYSDVTRQFASRRLRSTPRNSEVTSPSPVPPPPPAPAHRSRRLFNPNAHL